MNDEHTKALREALGCLRGIREKRICDVITDVEQARMSIESRALDEGPSPTRNRVPCLETNCIGEKVWVAPEPSGRSASFGRSKTN